MKVIYDLGANNGDDIPYYLTKSDKVVAVEANPQLANKIKDRFLQEIESGKLVVEACAVTINNASEVNFYLCDDPVLSTLKTTDNSRFQKTTLPAKNVVHLINEHGLPHYIKIDVEFYDHIILKYLFENGIRPPYISAESHTIEVFALMIALGNYNKFKIVDGATVHNTYPTFPPHAAGPFGEDVQGEWFDKDQFFNVLAEAKLGWKDIHATYL